MEVERAEEVVVEAQDLNAQFLKYRLAGLPARIVQHEIDHLDGKLIVDRTSPDERRRVMKELRERSRGDQHVNFAFAGTPRVRRLGSPGPGGAGAGGRLSSSRSPTAPAAGAAGRPHRRWPPRPRGWASSVSRLTTSTRRRCSNSCGRPPSLRWWWRLSGRS